VEGKIIRVINKTGQDSHKKMCLTLSSSIHAGVGEEDKSKRINLTRRVALLGLCGGLVASI